MTDNEHSSDPGYYPRIVELAHKVVASGMEPEKFTAGIPVEDPANPDEKALETARRIEALGCNVDFRRRGRRTIIFGRGAKGSGGSRGRG
jgi:hypothetical protein